MPVSRAVADHQQARPPRPRQRQVRHPRLDAAVRGRGREGRAGSVTGTSIMGLMMLGAAMGDTITIRAEGDGAEDAVGALCELVEAKFGED